MNGGFELDILRARNRQLEVRVAELEAWKAQALDDAGMACEDPCLSCAGCQYANERAGVESAGGAK